MNGHQITPPARPNQCEVTGPPRYSRRLAGPSQAKRPPGHGKRTCKRIGMEENRSCAAAKAAVAQLKNVKRTFNAL